MMPGYKGHVVGGLVAYAVMLKLVSIYWQPTALMMIEWLLFTMAGCLFPDIDVKSKGQKFSYVLLFLIFVTLLSYGYFELVALLAVGALIPLMSRHRGLFHNIGFISGLVGGAVCAAWYCTSIACRVLIIDALFFMAGVVSHLWLDMGLRRMLRMR